MKHCLLFLAVFFTAHTLAAAPGDGARNRPAIEVYAIASDGTPLQWQVYTPAGQGPWPAVLVIHGGRFLSGSFYDAGVGTCAQDLAAAGYIAFAINYRLAPPGRLPGQHSSGRFPDQYDDVQLAVLAARADSRANGQVGAVGGSAGGTHAAWVAATGTQGAERIDVGVCLSGAYDFSDFTPDRYLQLFETAVTNYVGVPASNTTALRAASPAWVLDRSVAPLDLFQTQGDLMPAAQFSDMVTQLTNSGATNFQDTTLPGSLHSFAYWPQAAPAAIAFLGRYLGNVP